MMQQLSEYLTALAGEQQKICVAFSGGVDSALLVKLCCEAGLETHAVTFDSTLQPVGEAAQAAESAKRYGARHILLRCDPLAQEEVRNNRRERCYHCKHRLFTGLREYAAAQGIFAVIDGTNADDRLVYRPGLRALRELGIVSPLAELGVTKAQVRELAGQLGLDVAKKPSAPCMATRFPYDTALSDQALAQVGQAEEMLRGLGFETVRVRVHDQLARIEVPLDRLLSLAEKAGEISALLRSLGYRRVTLDLEGFQSGCFDRED